jgi:hypothetical protein
MLSAAKHLAMDGKSDDCADWFSFDAQILRFAQDDKRV